MYTIQQSVEQYHLNQDNSSYVYELLEYLETKLSNKDPHPFNFLRLKSQELGFSKMSASNLTIHYWQCRGYSEDEAKLKIAEIQGARTSLKKRKAKMISEGMTSESADLKLKEWSKFKSKSVSDSHKRAQEKDPAYLKSMSHHCKEFWIKKGFSEEESVKKSGEICANNRKKFREKLDSGEIEKGWNNTTIEYYLKKGMTIDEARDSLLKRQAYTLEKCIVKYGEELGKEKWEARQEKWKNSIYSGESCIAVGTSRIFKEFLENFKDVTSEFFIRTVDYCFIFDIRKCKKLIEFDGDFWHCNPSKYTEDFMHPIKNKTAKEIWEYDELKTSIAESKGYTVLHIWESEFKLFPEATINKCKQFLNENN